MSEEEGESLLRNLFSIRDPTKKLSLVFKRQELHARAPKSLMSKTVRLCKACKETFQKWVFLRARKDGNCYCPVCCPQMF